MILMTNQLSFLGAECVQNNGSTMILTGPWLLYAIKLYSITVAIGDQTNVFMCSFSETDLSHHANLRMRVSTVQNGRFREGFCRWIHDEFVVVFLSKVSSYIYFYRKFSLVRPDDWWVNFTRPRAVLTRLGRPDKWLVRTLIQQTIGIRIWIPFSLAYWQYDDMCHPSTRANPAPNPLGHGKANFILRSRSLAAF